MSNSIMTMTGVLRAFDGYDRWEKIPFQKFGTKEELECLKNQLENAMTSKKKYVSLEIREASGTEKDLYKNQLQKEFAEYEKEYAEVQEREKHLSKLISERKEKIQNLEAFKIPY